MKPGDKVLFKTKKGVMEAEVAFAPTGKLIDIIVGSDPFPVTVKLSKVSACVIGKDAVSSHRKVRKVSDQTREKQKMTTEAPEQPSAKELRKQAQGLGITEWEGMGRKALAKAIAAAQGEAEAPAKTKTKKSKKSKNKPKGTAPKATKPEVEETPVPAKTKTKKAAAKAPATKAKTAAPKKAAKKAAPKVVDVGNESLGITIAKSHPKPTPENGINPFRPTSNLFQVAKLLLKGGQRESLAYKLSQHVNLHPYSKEAGSIDLDDYDKRLLLGAQTMRDQFGYGVQRTGRGIEGRILVFVPGGPTDPRNKKAKKSAKK